jgi:phytoene synthase
MSAHINISEHVASLKMHGKSFYFAGFFLGRNEFKRAAALYSFLRYVDDQVDEAPNPEVAREALQQLRESTLLSNASKVGADERDINNVAIAQASLDEFFRGMAYDIGTVAIRNQAELLDYCYCVAGTVGEMMCQVLHCHDVRATNHANDLGIAMQMTNIARDVYADALLGRRYIPGDWVQNASPSEILAPSAAMDALIRAAILRLIKESEPYYRSAYYGISLLPLRSRLAILAASRLYGGIGQAISAAHANNWQQRMILSRTRKTAIAAGSIGDFLTSSSLWRYQPQPSFGKPPAVLN